ncbi:hypothetical protein BU15DRAFT_77957 [Melanogaster broomeanus]|nr:hypothetical protein BU15DRAFT_77957 [Melanogaster broomeanus]
MFFSPLVASAIAAPVGNGKRTRSSSTRSLTTCCRTWHRHQPQRLWTNASQLNKRVPTYGYILALSLNLSETEVVGAELSKRSEDCTLVIPSLKVRQTPTRAGHVYVYMNGCDMAQGLQEPGVTQDTFPEYVRQALQITDPDTSKGNQLIPDSSSTSPGPDDTSEGLALSSINMY